MNRYTLLPTFLLSLIFSSPSYSEWAWLNEGVDGTTFYVDLERIRKQDGYVYWRELQDSLKPDKDGDLSYKLFNQGDCKLFRYKTLTAVYYKEPMGGGTGNTFTPKNPEWIYPSPDTSSQSILKFVCNR